MFSFILLILIYLCFISLGLQDSLFGAAWPSMYSLLDVPLSYAGIVSMIGAAMTVIATIFSVYVIKRFTAGKVVIASVIFTASALLGFSFSHSFLFLCLLNPCCTQGNLNADNGEYAKTILNQIFQRPYKAS